MKNLSFLKSTYIAHRGIYDNVRVYENTISSFERAINYNAIIEFDIRMLKDGTIVAFHDDELTRLVHVDGKVEDLNYEELCYISTYKIPTLSDVLELVRGKVPLLIEIKTNYKRGILENKICELLDNYDGLFAIQSYNIKSIKWFNKNRPNYIIGYLISKINFHKEYFFKKYDFINVNIELFDMKKLKKLRSEYFVIGYTIKNIEEYNKLVNMYDNFVFDNLLEIVDSLNYNKEI